MLEGVAVVLGLYIIARLVVGGPRWLSPVLRTVTIVAAILLVAGATAGLAFPGGLLALWSTSPTAAVKSEPEPLNTGPTATVTTADGGSITTALGFGIVLSKGSSLKREWIAVHDTAVPVTLEGTPGITTAYSREGYSGEYRYRATYKVKPNVAVHALRVRFLLFNVWGEFVRALDAEQVVDMEAGATQEITSEWRASSENEVGQHYASLAYVARARMADGRYVDAPTDAVVREAQKLSAKFTSEQIADPPAPASPVP